MAIKQSSTYHKDFSIKTYTEYLDGVEIIHNRYNRVGDLVYTRDKDGYWIKYKFDKNHRKVYELNVQGIYEKWKFNSKGYKVYYETNFSTSTHWSKTKYDKLGNVVYSEDAYGVIIDLRPKFK